jgi:hypothetical protein
VIESHLALEVLFDEFAIIVRHLLLPLVAAAPGFS